MKKIAIASLLALASATASAAGFVSLDVDHVTDDRSKATSTAQFVRAGTTMHGVDLGLTSRTAVAELGGLRNSLELTVGNKVGPLSPFVGIGHDNGLNGAVGSSFKYGVVGATAGTKIGPGFALAGIKTRVNWNDSAPKQTVVFGTYSIPVAKRISFNLNAGKSYQDIQEHSLGAGLSFKF